MATTINQDRPERGIVVVSATLSAQNDTVAFQVPRVTAMSLQVTGTFNGSTLALEASNDGTNYAALPTAVSLTAAGIKSVALADLGYLHYRLSLTVASPTGALTATIIGMEPR